MGNSGVLQRLALQQGAARSRRMPVSRNALLWVVMVSGGSSLEAQTRPVDVSHQAFDRILQTRVRAERVDYLGIRKHDAAALGRYLDRLAKVDAARLPTSARLAYYINLYNATMIDALVGRVVEGYTPAADDFGVFKEPLVRLRGRRVSLNALENEIIRKEFKEPRIHVALVCGARSCPPLLARAYTASNLDGLLEQNMRRFLADPDRNRIDRQQKVLRLSQIFSWYKVDFGGDQGLVGYLDRYTKASVKGFAVKHLPYSWDLNMQRPGAGWVSLRQRSGRLVKGSYLELVSLTGEVAKVRAADGSVHTLARQWLKIWGKPAARRRGGQ